MPMSGAESETFVRRDKYANCLSVPLTLKTGSSLDHNGQQKGQDLPIFAFFRRLQEKRMVKESIRRARQRLKRCINRIHIHA